MSVRLGDIIGLVERAYPPRLAQPWDSVGLVCGDPSESVDDVVVAVDATAAVVAEVPNGGLLLAHHPLLLRGVDTVAASTPKGALVHTLIRSGRALFTAHTNADSASPGVSDALAQAIGVEVDGVLSPLSDGPALDGRGVPEVRADQPTDDTAVRLRPRLPHRHPRAVLSLFSER